MRSARSNRTCGSRRWALSAASRPGWSPSADIDLELITPVPLPRKPSADLVRLPVRVRRAVKEARRVLDDVDADVVIGFGGYVAVPAYLAARRRGVPVVVHEANASAGWANKLGARSATPRALRGCRLRAAARRGGRRPGARRRSPRWTGWRNGRRPGRTSDSPTMRGCCWCSAVRRVRSRSTAPSRPRPKTLPRRVSRCCTRTAPRTPSICASPPTATRRTSRCRTSTGWISPTPQPIWRSAGPGR